MRRTATTGPNLDSDKFSIALAYVRFAIDHPGHYEVMFDKSLVDPSDPDLVAARAAAGAELSRGVAGLEDPRAAADPGGAELAAWVAGARVLAAVAQWCGGRDR